MLGLIAGILVGAAALSAVRDSASANGNRSEGAQICESEAGAVLHIKLSPSTRRRSTSSTLTG